MNAAIFPSCRHFDSKSSSKQCLFAMNYEIMKSVLLGDRGRSEPLRVCRQCIIGLEI